jgi:hypothetical protein
MGKHSEVGPLTYITPWSRVILDDNSFEVNKHFASVFL